MPPSHAGVSINGLTDERFLDELSGTAALNGVAVEVEAASATHNPPMDEVVDSVTIDVSGRAHLDAQTSYSLMPR